ncbi:hypothetical protein CR163_011055 [Prosthecochloris sp. ZM_2]|uniref:hypothetical protein n=1 Tax=Prosthecochloris sp. ZM_2 TaxID=2045206 RepID=UPI000DF856B8|nr:hypothetical protein [Prosthecochloris sp. ZM_2]RNA65701.1 hypothetical protein CR163_011055 [Prosthecochloris sp. ZM_2]
MAANGSYYGSVEEAGNYTDDPNGEMVIDSQAYGFAGASCCGADTGVYGGSGIFAESFDGAGSMDYSVSQLGVATTGPTSVTISNSSSASGSYTGDLDGFGTAGAGSIQVADNGNGSFGAGSSGSTIFQGY